LALSGRLDLITEFAILGWGLLGTFLVMALTSGQTQKDNGANGNERKHTLLEKITLVVAFLAFIAAGWQAYVASDNELTSLRAYVLVDSTTIAINNNNLPSVTIVIKNFGATPARRARHWATSFVRPVPAQDNSFPDFTSKVIAPYTLIPEQGTKQKIITDWSELPDRAPMTAAERSDIKNGTKAIYIAGVIRYEDVFGQHHITQYRRYWNDPSGQNNVDDGSGGNCTDNDCEPQPLWQNIVSRFWHS
jgi:hypothetical protein